MALFVRNCKLVLLLRREFKSGEENVFRPAEWRWKLPQVCDDEWHHYAVNVKFPDVELVVDGDKWISVVEENDSKKPANPEIIDDWPLHPVAGSGAKVSVGACWQGSEESYKHQMRGYLAGVSYVKGATENLEALKCLHQCAESLQIPTASAVAAGMEMVADAKGAKVIADGSSANGLQDLIKQVAYLNTREFPAPGQRLLALTSTVTCANGQTVQLQEKKAVVSVAAVQEPRIDIDGTREFGREYEDFRLGVRVFADVHIVMTTGAPGNGKGTKGLPVVFSQPPFFRRARQRH